MPITPESLYMQLGEAVRSMPDLERCSALAPETLTWLGKVHALILAQGDPVEVGTLKAAVTHFQSGAQNLRAFGVNHITAALYRALAVAELNAPSSVQGAFIPTGNAFDAMAAVGKVLQEAKQDVLMVDPYMDMTALEHFAVLTPEQVPLRLLADQRDHKATLKPAVARWAAQHGTRRPITARLAAPKSLHDRLIVVDGTVAWTLTQSFNRLAARSPASIGRVDPETAALKVAAYETMWQAAVPI